MTVRSLTGSRAITSEHRDMSASPINLPSSAGTTATPRLSTWLQTARVQSFAIASIGVLVGGAVAWHEGQWHGRLLLAWIGGVLLQAGTNLLNVSYNYKGGGSRGPADPAGSSAPVRQGLLTAPQVRQAAIGCFVVGSLIGFWLVAELGRWILMIGAIGVFFGWCYSAPPLRLAYRGGGVLAAAICMGPGMVMGAHHVVTRGASAAAWLTAIAVGLLAGGILHVNDLRDLESDRAHGKRTLSTMLGRHRAHGLLVVFNLLALTVIAGGVVRDALPVSTLLVLLVLPTMVIQVRTVVGATDQATLNRAWFQSIRVHGQFGLLLIGGFLLAS
jgi:1,4-dihydroxy-2-naphthoate polyprenyltransferase